MKLHFTEHARADSLHWVASDAIVHRRVNELIEGVLRHPFTGVGKPEGLKGDLSRWWSRRITGDERRLVYRVAGRAGEDQSIEVMQCQSQY